MAKLALIGFGEAAQAFVSAWPDRPARIAAFDSKTTRPATEAAKRAEYIACGITGAASPAEALADADWVLSLVTADQALAAATNCAPHLPVNALWCDMNSVAPDTKRDAARVIHAAGGRYVDVAVMAPVHPARAAVPLLLAGRHATAGAESLRAIGFTRLKTVAGEIGQASAIKMIRSVVVKGIEALTAECVLAASEAGVLDEVLASLDDGPAVPDWSVRADYNLDRMLVHGLRRAAEMEEVVKTLNALGTGSQMSEATTRRQRAIGRLGLVPPAGLAAKLQALRAPRRQDAA